MIPHFRIRKVLPVLFLTTVVITTLVMVRVLYREPPVDRSIVSGFPCSIPCWQGITPGVTTHFDALKVLQDSPYVEQRSVKQSGDASAGGVTWEWHVPSRRLLPHLSWSNGVVQEIVLGLPFELKIQEMLDNFSVPEGLIVSSGGQPEAWYWIVDFYYPDLGAQFKAYTLEFSDTVEPSTSVDVVVLFPQMSFEERISHEFGEADIIDYRRGLFRTWVGFGNIFEAYYQDRNELVAPN